MSQVLTALNTGRQMPCETTAGNEVELDIERGAITVSIQMGLKLGTPKAPEKGNGSAEQGRGVSQANTSTDGMGESTISSSVNVEQVKD